MSTRGGIGIINSDGTITGIYCHWDNYISNNGKILFEHYNDSSKVKELMALGDLSSLGEEIGQKHNWNNRDEYCFKDGSSWCNAYGRDREEEDVSSRTFKTFEEFFEHYQECWGEYIYLFDPAENDKNNSWKVWDTDNIEKCQCLSEALTKEEGV